MRGCAAAASARPGSGRSAGPLRWPSCGSARRAASTSCASSIDVTTALSGSQAVPVASDWAAPLALCWVCSSEEIALVSASPRPPPSPPAPVAARVAASPPAPSAPVAPGVALRCRAPACRRRRPSRRRRRRRAGPAGTCPIAPIAGIEASPPVLILSSPSVAREHRLGRLHRRHVGLVGARLGDQVDHFGDRADVRHLHVALGVGFGVAGVVDELVGRLVGDDPGDLDATGRSLSGAGRCGGAERAFELAPNGSAGRSAQARPPGGGRAGRWRPRRLRVGEVLGGDVHAHAFGGEAAAGDVDRVEQPHQSPIARAGFRCARPSPGHRLVFEPVLGERAPIPGRCRRRCLRVRPTPGWTSACSGTSLGEPPLASAARSAPWKLSVSRW